MDRGGQASQEAGECPAFRTHRAARPSTRGPISVLKEVEGVLRGPLEGWAMQEAGMGPTLWIHTRVPAQRDLWGRAAGPGPDLDLAEMDIISV